MSRRGTPHAIDDRLVSLGIVDVAWIDEESQAEYVVLMGMCQNEVCDSLLPSPLSDTVRCRDSGATYVAGYQMAVVSNPDTMSRPSRLNKTLIPQAAANGQLRFVTARCIAEYYVENLTTSSPVCKSQSIYSA
jgi:hypothetical protein